MRPSLQRLLSLLPILVLLVLATRAIELATAWPSGLAPLQGLSFAIGAVLTDLLATLRYLPLLTLVLWPALRSDSPRIRAGWAIALFASLLLTRGALSQYRATAGVPLGADLFGYSWQDIRQTLGGARLDFRSTLSLMALLAVMALAGWAIARLARRTPGVAPRGVLAALMLACAGSWALTAGGWNGAGDAGTEHLRTLRQNTLAWFIDDAVATSFARFRSSDPAVVVDAYPFLHDETTPDVLGPLLHLPDSPPDFVFIIVEGLGRSYSGPDAKLGSFTPFLDSLADEGLYWENFIAPQGRTFAVLPSLLGSLPFGEQGVLDMASPLPAHANLPTLLKGLGYQSRFFSGFDAAFDNERRYLEQTGFDTIIDRGRISTLRPIANEWGYDDDVLLQVARDTPRLAGKPTFDVIQTISSHDPFRVPSQANWDARVDSRLAELGITGDRARSLLAHRKVLASVLFTDDALRRHIEKVRKDPVWSRTIFLITGDHRLPEIPMDERLERYHVPLLIWSPMLRAPLRSKAVSSQFDVLPSLGALMAMHYGLARPTLTSWLGRGLDVSPVFRMEHAIPLKQTKTEPPEYLAEGSYLSQVGSWRLRDGLRQEGPTDAEVLKRIEIGLTRFNVANAAFAATGQLQAETAAPVAARSEAVPTTARSTQLAIREVKVLASPDGRKILQFSIENDGEDAGVLAAPLAVIVDERGGEHGEAYGQAVALAPREKITLQLPLDTSRLGSGRHFVSIFPSDPDTGKRIGEGQFKLPLDNTP